MKKESSGFENFFNIIMSIILFVFPIFNIAINNWFSGLEQCLFFINIIPLCIIALVLLIKTFNHKDEESFDFWLNNDLKGFIYKFFAALLTLSNIFYGDIKKKNLNTVDFFILKLDIKTFEIVSLIIMTVIIAGSLCFYSYLEKNKKEPDQLKKETKRLNKIFAIDLFVFIEYLAALLAIEEINSFDFDDWILFSLVFLIVFIVILINAPKIKSIFSKIKSFFLPVFSKIKLKDHSESTATEEPKGQLESEAKELPETKFKGMTKEEEDKFLNKNEIINLSEAKELLRTKFKGMTKEEKEEFLTKVNSYIKPPK